MEENDLRDKALDGDQQGRLDPQVGEGADLRHDREPSRLVHLPPALLGCADHRLLLQGLRRGHGRCRGHAPCGRPLRGTRFRHLVRPGSAQSSCRREPPARPAAATTSTRRWTSSMSGSTPASPMPRSWRHRANLGSPADMYLEGSDQHRGWFHSSLLACVGTRGNGPVPERAHPRLRRGRRRAAR